MFSYSSSATDVVANPLLSSGGSTTGSPPATATSSSSSATNSAIAAAPTDGGCPGINNIAYTPVDAGGSVLSLKSGKAQSFQQLCSTNYPSGATYGNPGIHDIMRLWLPSLEACITACAEYNAAYQWNEGAGVAAGGLCRSVAVIKEGESVAAAACASCR